MIFKHFLRHPLTAFPFFLFQGFLKGREFIQLPFSILKLILLYISLYTYHYVLSCSQEEEEKEKEDKVDVRAVAWSVAHSNSLAALIIC